MFVFDPTNQLFVFDLRGAQVVPPVSTPARGGCFGQFDAADSRLALTCVHDVVGATVMHVHRGAAGVNGEIVFDLGDPASPVDATWTGLTPADVADLLAGNFYVDVHSAGRPAGEIRGQILPRTVDVVNFTASGAQVVPPDPTAATAACTADLDGPATSLAVQCTHNVPGPIEGHVHEAPAGQTGPAVFTFLSAASPLTGHVPTTGQLVADFAAAFLYLDIHAAESAQIRGQIGTPTTPNPATRLSITAPPSATAGSASAFTVTALDQWDDVATGYTGTVHFTTSDAGAGSTVPADYTFTAGDNGVKTFTGGATFVTAGGQTLTATDTGSATITGTSNVVQVSAADATHFTVTAPAAVGAGAPFSFTVTARDQFDNVATGYAGTIRFTSSDPRATLPPDAGLTGGGGTFTATLRTAGSQTITGTDTLNGALTGTSGAIVVSPGAATRLALSAPAGAVLGVEFTFTVTALDAFDNVATGYAGTVHFTSSDPVATLPPDAALANGTGTFSAALRTPGERTLTATDTANGAITGTATIAVAAAIPTLGEGAFLLLAALLVLTALRALRARGPS